MRASAVPLQAMLKDEHRSNTDICPICSFGSREDQQHMLLQCTAYEKERKIMMDELARRLSGNALVKQWNCVESFTIFLLSDSRCDSAVRTFLGSAFTQRCKLIGDKPDIDI